MVAGDMALWRRAYVLSYTSGDGSTLLHAAVAPKPSTYTPISDWFQGSGFRVQNLRV
jgi:hypothetical protein